MGTEVVLDLLPTGEIVIRPSEVVRARVRKAAERLALEQRAGLDRLAAYDRGEIDGATVRGPVRDKSAHD